MKTQNSKGGPIHNATEQPDGTLKLNCTGKVVKKSEYTKLEDIAELSCA